MAILDQDLDSSMIDNVQYDTDTNTLVVRFQNGWLYIYEDVDEDVFDEIISAPSAGRWFADNVRYNYDYARLESRKYMKNLIESINNFLKEEAVDELPRPITRFMIGKPGTWEEIPELPSHIVDEYRGLIEKLPVVEVDKIKHPMLLKLGKQDRFVLLVVDDGDEAYVVDKSGYDYPRNMVKLPL